MFGSLFHQVRPAGRCALRLESLDGRVLPGGLAGGVVAGGGAGLAAHGDVQAAHVGEEIPQTVSIRDGHVDSFAGRGGISGDV